MTTPPIIEVGKPLPANDAYMDDKMARRFWRVSFRCGREYQVGKDARGHNILHKHEREEADSYKRRQLMTKPRNHCGPIIRKYNDFVFRRPAERAEQGGSLYELLVEDADGMGTSLPSLMRHACRMAQIERESFLIPDSNAAPDPSIVRSVAQAAQAKVRPFLRLVSPDAVIWWRDRSGVLVEAMVLLQELDGTAFVNWYTETTITRIALRLIENPDNDVEYEVLEMGPAVPHSAGACPVVRLRPLFDQDDDYSAGESQIAPLAELQQSIFNLTSLLNEELYNGTFTQFIATGVSADMVKDAKVGNNRIMCLPDAASKFTQVGADTDQAASLRLSITDEQRELYRIAGVQTSDPLDAKGQAESGAARAFKFNDLAANLSALAQACELAENSAMGRLFAMNKEAAPEDATYPNDFQMPEFESELEVCIRALTVAQMPSAFKRAIAGRFAQRNLSLETDELTEALNEISDADQDAGLPLPFPRMTDDSGSSRSYDADNNPLANPLKNAPRNIRTGVA